MTAADVCIPNIGPLQRRRRAIAGFVMTAVALAAFAALVGFGADRWWRLALFVPLYGAGLGYVQALEHTCVALAARNQRNFDAGTETIHDTVEREQIRRQARLVYRNAVVAAAALTILALAV